MTVRWLPRIFRTFAGHLLFDAMIVIAGAVLAVIIIDHRNRVAAREIALTHTRAAVRVLQANVDLHAALARESSGAVAYPQLIETLWFEEEVPTNLLLDSNRPWVEIAGENELGLRHPRNPTVDGGHHAMFWYNPALGVVRARVPRTLSDAEALTIYNEVNGTRLLDLTVLSGAEDRE
jgi:hypothetical protein